MRKTITKVLIIIVAIASLFTLVHIRNTRYVWNYAAVVGWRRGESFENMIARLGEPDNIYFRDHAPDMPVIQYGGVGFIVMYHHERSWKSPVRAVIVTCSEIRFGRRQIGVGSTRDEVMYAYTRIGIRISHEGNRLGVTDGGASVNFFLDENDKVESISITYGGP